MSRASDLPSDLPEHAIDRSLLCHLILHRFKSSSETVTQFAAANGIHRSTLWRWCARLAAGKPLIDARHLRTDRTPKIDPRILGYALCYLNAYPKTTYTALAEVVGRISADEGWDIVSYYKLKRIIQRLPDDMITLLRNGFRDAFHEMSATVRRQQDSPGELCQMDSTELDLWVLDVATGQLVKVWMTTIIDCYSRCILGLAIHRSAPTTVHVIALLKQAILPKNRDDYPFYCLMKELQSDNASCFKAKEVKEVLLRLGIVYSHSPNNAPNANGKQERFFLTFKRQFLTHLLGYSGQAGGLAKAGRAAIPWPLLESLSLDYLRRYHTSFHRGIGLSPWEKWMEALEWAGGLQFEIVEVLEAFKVRHSVVVRRANVNIPGLGEFSSPALVGLSNRMIEVRYSREDAAPKPEAFLGGESLGTLRPWAKDKDLPDDIARARLDRLKELKQFRRDLNRAMKTAPPIVSPATRMARRSGRKPKAPGNAIAHGSAATPSAPIPKLSTED